MDQKNRVTVRITPDNHKFFKEESERLGYTMHGFLVLALNTFREQYELEQKKKGQKGS